MKQKLFFLLTLLTLTVGAWGQNRYQNNIEKAKQGNASAQCNIGYCYDVGEGVTQDYTQAVYWYKKAAEQGNATAQGNLGICYYNGRGVTRDYAQAVYWYKKAAGQGNVDAQNNLGFCYKDGKGVTQDYAQANYWFKKAAEKGNANAQCSLGYNYEKGRGVTKDYAQAVYWYKKAAEQGYDIAQSNLGICYYNGNGVDKDYAQAVYWFHKAAEQEHANGMSWMGFCYYNGYGVTKDLQQAVYWYKKAADKGNSFAQKNLVKAEDELRKQNMASGNNRQQDRQTAIGEKDKKEEVVVKKETAPVVTTMADVDKNIPVSGTNDRNLFAVIIGNEKYDNEENVPFAENDARVFKEYAMKTLGMQEKQIKYVANASLGSMKIAVKWLENAMKVCGGKGKALFYYAGHGIPDEANKSAYLLPVDGQGSFLESAYPLSQLYSDLAKMPAERVTVFLDACFSGTKRDGRMMASARGVAIKVKASAPQGKMVVFTAAQDDETAYPYSPQRHGMFTYYLLRKLQESRGNVTLGELGDYLKEEVPRQAFMENNKVQTPSVNASTSLQANWRNMRLK